MKTRSIIYTFLTVCMIFIVHTTFLKTGKAENQSIVKTSDLSNHPVYSNYKFNNSEEVVNLGTQPFFSPTGFITEVMKRDTILYNALSVSGLKIRFFPFLKGNDINFFIHKGDIDVGICGDMPTITAAATMDVTVSSIVQQGFCSVVARRSMLMRELRGKKIGYALGSNAHYALLRALASGGLNESLVHMIPMDVNEMPEALLTGEVAAFSAWEPTPAITLMKYPESTIIHRYISSGFMYFTRAFSENQPELIRHILAAEVRALRWMKSDRQNLLLASEWAIQAGEDLTNHKFELSVKQNAFLAENDILGLISAPIIPQNDLRQNGPLHMEFELLKTLDKIPTTSNWEKVHNSFDFQVINDVLANSKEYKLSEFSYDIE
ncbi:MAG: ABC transporter substrate-binding protein [Candidatus Scalindua sp.]|jgi:sulfonate transport system substrate-binding protein|nr:ABC transporter substrate-binding protein [Candidatus Scalindua sp.]MBT5307120.1 ABC transporter substrate-binding protein [Candidatus Scalindua sp.]MBT6051318.1 ABC transporter substrate-binding protein [Candidatus Scalindua sp.]MBT6228258.1 ABC transporter substrate-binding protein [Candidatus Scalindua sp.]MBT6563411.1 ABC transporter substrate-binding protein [Candidatus Scalindua sp.]